MTLPARTREAYELGSWGASDAFGVEVRCGTTCAASLVMWDPEFRIPNTSVPVVMCEAR